MMYNRIIIGIFTGLLFLFCIGGVSGAVITIDDSALAGNSGTISVLLDEAENGLAGYKIGVTFGNPTVEITKVTFPSWAILNKDDPKPPTASTVLSGVDLGSTIKPGETDITLFTVEISSDGSPHQMKLDVKELTDYAGNEMKPTIGGGPKPTPTPTVTTTTTPTPTVTTTTTPTPTATSTVAPTKTPTHKPTAEPTKEPTHKPTHKPTAEPTGEPTVEPTPEPTPEPLAAAFTFDKIGSKFVIAPITVHFTDLSTGNPETYLWDFGDGEVSVVQNPQHTYRRAGTYTVSLTVSNDDETSTTRSEADIVVVVPQPIPVPRQNGVLAIGSIPQGADIYLNGAYYGKTPIQIKNLTPHRYQVRLVMPGYYDSVTTIPIWTGPMPSYRAAILLKAVPPNVGKVAAEKPQTGSAYIVTYPKEVDVYFEDTYLGSSDIMITHIPTGAYNITLKREGFADWPGQIDVLTAKTVMQVYHYDYPTYERVASEYFDQPSFTEGDA